MQTDFELRFLGTGNSSAEGLGCSSAVLERAGKPLLMIDCGHDSLGRYRARYADALPSAIFITHPHLDHIAGLEGLFYAARFDPGCTAPIRLYVPVPVIEWLHKRVADYPNILAEGGANFWDGFQLIPVSERFWHAGLQFSVFPARHHQFQTAYGLALQGRFVFTGDTRPIPEVLNRFAGSGETVFHDCALQGNPSHTGVDDLARCYSEEYRRRLVLYHYESFEAGEALATRGYRVARPGDGFALGLIDSKNVDSSSVYADAQRSSKAGLAVVEVTDNTS